MTNICVTPVFFFRLCHRYLLTNTRQPSRQPQWMQRGRQLDLLNANRSYKAFYPLCVFVHDNGSVFGDLLNICSLKRCVVSSSSCRICWRVCQLCLKRQWKPSLPWARPCRPPSSCCPPLEGACPSFRPSSLIWVWEPCSPGKTPTNEHRPRYQHHWVAAF